MKYQVTIKIKHATKKMSLSDEIEIEDMLKKLLGIWDEDAIMDTQYKEEYE